MFLFRYWHVMKISNILPQVEEHEEQGTLFVSVLQYCIVSDEECGGLSEGQEDQDSDVCDSG